MEFAKIVALCIVAAIVYGIAHDMVTAHVCVEYFTIGHPRVIASEAPVLLALAWGVLATWWMGLLLGIPLAVVSRAGRRPRLRAADLVRPIAVVLGAMAAAALAAGLVGRALAATGNVWLLDPMASRVPAARHTAFLTDLWAHNAAYLAGLVGGIVLCVLTWRRRGRIERRTETLSPKDAPQCC